MRTAATGAKPPPSTPWVLVSYSCGYNSQPRAVICPTGPNRYVTLCFTCARGPWAASDIDTRRFRPWARVKILHFWVVCGLALPQYAADHRNIAHAFAPGCILNVQTIIYIRHLIRFRPTGQFRQNTGFGQGRVNRHWSAPRVVFSTYCTRNRNKTPLF